MKSRPVKGIQLFSPSKPAPFKLGFNPDEFRNLSIKNLQEKLMKFYHLGTIQAPILKYLIYYANRLDKVSAALNALKSLEENNGREILLNEADTKIVKRGFFSRYLELALEMTVGVKSLYFNCNVAKFNRSR